MLFVKRHDGNPGVQNKRMGVAVTKKITEQVVLFGNDDQQIKFLSFAKLHYSMFKIRIVNKMIFGMKFPEHFSQPA